MSQNKHTLIAFYQAFQKLDYQTMASCYHEKAEFKDEVFDLKGQEINAMWHMLCDKATDFTLSFDVDESSNELKVNWQANYLFSQTGRPVENKITVKKAETKKNKKPKKQKKKKNKKRIQQRKHSNKKNQVERKRRRELNYGIKKNIQQQKQRKKKAKAIKI